MNLVEVCSIGRKTLGSQVGLGQDETSRQVTKVRSKKQFKVTTQNAATDGGKSIEGGDSLQSQLKTISGLPVKPLWLEEQELTNVLRS